MCIHRKRLEEDLGTELSEMVNSRSSIERYHRATNGNRELMITRLKATAKWRSDHRVDYVDCSACLLDSTTHYLHLVGHTSDGHPILYSNFKLPTFPRTEAGKKGVLDHMILVFEGAIRSSPNPGTAQFVWLNDFHGFGLVDAANVSLPMAFISMMANHYPERLRSLLVLDAPSIISPLWNMCKPIIDPKTHSKIKFLPYDLDKGESSKLLPVLKEARVDEELMSWMDQEMKAVRHFSYKKGPRPIYDLHLIRKCAQDKALPPPAEPPSDSHSHYGADSLMKMLLKDSNCLHPLKTDGVLKGPTLEALH
jgi:hypothetical protein